MSNENNTTIIEETKTSEVIDDVVSAAAKRADENEDISHLRDIMSSENENDELTSDSAVFGIKEDGKPDFSSPIKNNVELKEADLDIDEIDSIDEVNDKNISDSVVNGDTAKIMDLTDEEADNIARILIVYKNNKKMNVYREMVPSLKARINSICFEAGIPLNQANMVTKYMMDQFLSTASAEKEFIDIEKTIERTMKIPSMVDIYMDHINDTMDVKLPAMAEAMKEREPEKAAKLLAIRDEYNNAFLFSRLRNMYDTNARLRKLCRRDCSDLAVKKAAEYANFLNDKTNFKMPDSTNIPGIIKNIMIDLGYNKYDEAVDMAINKFCILLFNSAGFLDLNDINDAAFYYYMVKNISMMAYLGDKKSDFSAELISNINITMHYITIQEVEFYEQNNNKRPKKRKHNSSK